MPSSRRFSKNATSSLSRAGRSELPMNSDVARALREFLDLCQMDRQKRVGDVRQQVADGAAVAGTQVAGGEVRLVPQPRNGLLHALAHGLARVAAAVEHTGHGADGHLGGRGDISDRYTFGHGLRE